MRIGLTGFVLALAVGVPGVLPGAFAQAANPVRPGSEASTAAGEAYLDALASPQMHYEPALSPDGRYLAHLTRSEIADDEAVYLVVTDLDAAPGENQRITSFGEMSPDWVIWANNDRILAGVTLDMQAGGWLRSLDGLPLVSRIISIDRSFQRNPVTLFGAESRALNDENWQLNTIVDMLPDDPDHILMPARRGEGVHLWRVDLLTGEAEIVERGTRRTVAWNTMNGVAVMRAELLRGNAVRISTRNGPEGNWREADTFLRPELDEREEEFAWAGFTETPNQILVLARPDGTEYTGIYRYDLEAGTFLEPIARRDDFDITAAMVDPQTGAYVGYSYVDDRVLYELESPSFRPQYAALLNFFGDQMEVNPISTGGSRMVLRADGPVEPGSIYLYDLETHAIEPVFSLWPQLTRIPLFPVEPAVATAEDGMTVPGYVTWPASGPGPDTPLIVYPHGGPELRDRVRFGVMVQYLANLGYAVYQPNYRGSAGYGRTFMEAGHGEWGLAMQRDISAGVDALAASGRIDPDQVCIVGFSYGGYAALAGSMMEPDRYRCAVAGGGVYDLADFVNRDDPDLRDYWAELIGEPRDPEDAERLTATSPRLNADRLTLPVLLYHGEDDEIVPVDQSRDMARALNAAGQSYFYIEDEGVGHSWGGDSDSTRRIFRNVRDFLADAMDGSLDSFEPEPAP